MAKLRERLADAIGGRARQQTFHEIQSAMRQMYEAYLEGPFVLPPEDLRAQLREQYDAGIITDLVDQLYWETLGGPGYGIGTEAERGRAVNESRRAWKHDVITQWIVWLWTNYGFGEHITITPVDEAAEEDWSEFWEADRNQPLLADDELQHLSETLLTDGELFLVFSVSTLDGAATVRTVDTKEITEPITHPEDDKVPLFYKRQWTTADGKSNTWYYPDWRAVVSDEISLEDVKLPQGAIRADKQNNLTEAFGEQDNLTDVLMLHIAHNRKGQGKESLRGWPLMTAGAPWSRTHKKFREDRAAVAAAVAMYVRKLKLQGGSRAVADMRNVIASNLSDLTNVYDTNPPAVAGATWLENQAADMSAFPLTTAAGDAKMDGEALLLMAGLGGGVFPHWLGAGDAYRLATATAMEGPLLREFSRYQSFWAAQFRKMVRIVLWAKNEYGGKNYDDFEAEVSTDRLVEVDLAMFTGALTALYKDALLPLVDTGIIPPDTARKIALQTWRLALQALGVTDVEEMTSEEAFNIGVEEEEEEAVELPPELPPDELPEMAQRVAEVILANAEDGSVDWQTVAEWALEERLGG